MAAAKEMTKPAPTKPAVMNSLIAREFANLDWRLTAPSATPADIKDPAFWSVVQAKLRSFDRVQVISQTHVYDVLILYTEVGCPTMVEILRTVVIPERKESEHGQVPAGYKISYDPGSCKYTGRRVSDDHPLTAEHGRWSDAYHELIGHSIFRDNFPNAG